MLLFLKYFYQSKCNNKYQWITSIWSKCSNLQDSCKGTKHRSVICIDSNGVKSKDHNYCSIESKPPASMATCDECSDYPQQDLAIIPILRSLGAGESSDIYGVKYVYPPLKIEEHHQHRIPLLTQNFLELKPEQNTNKFPNNANNNNIIISSYITILCIITLFVLLL